VPSPFVLQCLTDSEFDANEQIQNITYDTFLKQPIEVLLTDGRKFKNYYDGSGKLFGTVYLDASNTVIETWEFVGGTGGVPLTLKDGQFYQMVTPDGRATYNGSTWEYEFGYKDHLGNTRVSFKAENGQLIKTAETAFDPWGLRLSGVGSVNGFANRWEMQGYESEETFGLNRINFGARTYNPTIGRFDRVDAMSEEYYGYSPFNYVLNNPINLFDPDGNEPCCGKISDFFSGVSAALVDNSSLIPSNYRADRAAGKDPTAFKAGEVVGDLLSIGQGVVEMALGGGEATVTTAGVVAAPAAAIGVAAAAHGGAVVVKATTDLVSRSYNSEGSSGRGKNHLQPDSKAEADHSTFRTNPQTGKTTNTTTHKKNSQNPKTGFSETKRVDVEGNSHRHSKTGREMKTPHVHEPKQKNPRPARSNELPKQ
jgi:RHS repeat-associated protein